MDRITIITVISLLLLFAILVQLTRCCSRFERFLPSLNYIVQIIFLVVAVYGYIFTVKPLYENKELQRGIDEKEDEISAIEQRTEDLRAQLTKVESERRNATARLKETRVERRKIEDQLWSSKQKLNDVRTDINNTYRKIYVANLRSASISYFYRYVERETNNRFDYSITAAIKVVPTPYEAIMAVLDNNDYNAGEFPVGNEFHEIVPDDVKQSIIKIVRSKLKKNKSELSQPGINSQSIERAYEKSDLRLKSGDKIFKIKPSDDSPITNVMYVQSDRIIEFFEEIQENR